MACRRPTPAELGLDVTIAIVAMTISWEIFICVSDRMVSHDDQMAAADNAVIKNLALSRGWSVAYSANDLKYVFPIVENVRAKMSDTNSVDDIKLLFSQAFSEIIRSEFTNKHLRRYGYNTVEEFRRDGRNDLGDHFFDLCRILDSSDLATSFIVYGYDNQAAAHLFEVSSTGEITDRRILRYAVIGSGYSMAAASLRRKKMTFEFKFTIYRLLEAKFSAETASGVGRSTTMTIKRRGRFDSGPPHKFLEQIRTIWETEMLKGDPQEAIASAATMHPQTEDD